MCVHIPLNHTKRPRLASYSNQCPLQLDATTAWHNIQILGKLT